MCSQPHRPETKFAKNENYKLGGDCQRSTLRLQAKSRCVEEGAVGANEGFGERGSLSQETFVAASTAAKKKAQKSKDALQLHLVIVSLQ
jgi:hypothetical protein